MKFTTSAGEVDVVLETLAAGDYAALAPRAVTYEVFGIRLAVASLDDIIASKAASGRPKDRAHLPVLRQLARELASAREASGEASGEAHLP